MDGGARAGWGGRKYVPANMGEEGQDVESIKVSAGCGETGE